MILVYNLSGLLLIVAGAAVGIVAWLTTGYFSFAILFMSLVWLTFGWRKTDPVTKAKKPYSSVFFIPLVFVAMPLVVLSVPMLLVERVAKAMPRDPRAALLDADEAELRTTRAGGDRVLSAEVLKHLATIVDSGNAKVEDYHVFTRVKPDAVLVLVLVPNLKQYQDTAREQLLNLIEGMLMAEDRTQGKRVYIGVKGRVSYGAIRGPDDFTKTGAVVLEKPLYDFYGPGGPMSTRAATGPGA